MRILSAEIADGAIYLIVEGRHGDIEIMAHAKERRGVLYLWNLHVDGPGANTVGLGALRRLCHECMEIADVSRLVVKGGRRTTGASPGRIPHRLRFDRKG